MKENEKELYADIALLFQPPRKLAGTSAPPLDFREATTLEKGHGRMDKRSIVVSSVLAEYHRDWSNLAQVYKVERQSTNALGITKTQIRYGVTSLPEQTTPAQHLLTLTRGHWGIENGLHYRRDVTFHEDQGQIRMGTCTRNTYGIEQHCSRAFCKTRGDQYGSCQTRVFLCSRLVACSLARLKGF